MSMPEFLKRFSTIPNAFIDDFFSLIDGATTQVDHVVNLDMVAKWLGVRKANLLLTLRESYVKDIDYTVAPAPKLHRHGGHREKVAMLTPDCFKRLCMRSRSKRAEDVRTYFIQLEALVIKYREQMMAGMEQEVSRMERNLKPKSPDDRAGYIYVIKASSERDSVYKIGRTKDLARRLSEYQTGREDEVDVVFRFRTDNLVATETCLKSLLKARQLRKYREVYEANIDLIKELVAGCGAMAGMVKLEHASRKAPTQQGGYYCVLCSVSP
jgi:phage anti-repressor protein/predicted GIY-YIG superfamily endonuclease